LLDRSGETSGSSVDAVLDVDGGEVGIAVEIEGSGDLADAVVVAGGGDVLHAFGAVDLLLERRSNGGFDSLSAGPGIDGDDTDLRRREVRELCDGQRGNTNRAGENDQQGADRGEDGAMNKKVDHKVIGPSGDRIIGRSEVQ
jgi:hypothetical protein